MAKNTIDCTCKSDFQDQRYGAGQRVFTLKANGSKVCTVCEKEKGGANDYSKKVKK